MKKLVVLVALLSLFAAACQTDTVIEAGSDAAGSTTVPEAATATPGTVAQDTSADDAADDGAPADDAESGDQSSGVQATDPTPAPAPTDAPADSTATDPAPTEAPADDADSAPVELGPDATAAIQAVVDADDWCEAAQAVETGTEAFDTLNFTDPVELERGVKQSLAVIAASQRLVPNEIAADVDQTVEGFTAFADALEAANWSFIDLDLSVLENLDGPMTLATYNIELYNFNVCGIGIDPGVPPTVLDDGSVDTGDDDDASLPEFDGTIRDQAVQGLVEAGFTAEEANCILEDLDFSDPEALSDPSALLTVFTDCGISLDRLAQLGG